MTDATAARPGERRPIALLALGATAGIALAVASLLAPNGSDSLPDGSVARVNHALIRESQLERALAAMASDRRSPLTPSDRRHILDRLIDEELLVQYGLELGLAESDRRVRADLVSAVLASQVASVDGFAPSDEAVNAFFRENREFFQAPGRLRVRSLWIRAAPDRSDSEALAAGEAAVQRLRAGDSLESVAERFGDREVAPAPDVLLPPAKLREYIGPTAVRVVAGLAVGQVSDPLVSGGAVRVFVLVDREASVAPALAEVRNEVLSEMKRRAGDEAVRSLLDRLRDGADLELSESVE